MFFLVVVTVSSLVLVLRPLLSFHNGPLVHDEWFRTQLLDLHHHHLPQPEPPAVVLTIEGQMGHAIQTLVLSPHVGVVVAVGALDLHTNETCPFPEYYPENVTLSDPSRTTTTAVLSSSLFFKTLYVETNMGYSGPLLLIRFNVTEPVWRRLLRRPYPLALHNNWTQTTQTLTPLVDPALIRSQPPHRLAATTTIRKHYRYYLGQDKRAQQQQQQQQQQQPQSWSLSHLQDRLHWWLQHHRALGVQHFYIVDNDPHDNDNNDNHPPPLVSGPDITYIWARDTPYDVKHSCHHQEQDATVSGQSILENSIIRMVHADWLLVCDMDEFMVPGPTYNHSLLPFIEHCRTQYCRGGGGATDKWLNLVCTPAIPQEQQQQSSKNKNNNNNRFIQSIANHGNKTVFAITLTPILVLPPDGRVQPDILHRRKNILIPAYTSYLDVHEAYSYLDEDNEDNDNNKEETMASTHVPVEWGYMAHLQDRIEGLHNMTALVPQLPRFLPQASAAMATLAKKRKPKITIARLQVNRTKYKFGAKSRLSSSSPGVAGKRIKERKCIRFKRRGVVCQEA